ncbi:hypothetical protein GH733_012020 [Mirounga leonina]|nr:hypothetical protein GH733_012020 [Mirounga leonina]
MWPGPSPLAFPPAPLSAAQCEDRRGDNKVTLWKESIHGQWVCIGDVNKGRGPVCFCHRGPTEQTVTRQSLDVTTWGEGTPLARPLSWVRAVLLASERNTVAWMNGPRERRVFHAQN